MTVPKEYSLGLLFIVEAATIAKFPKWKIMLKTKMSEIFLKII
jgi:hypothetical protein